LYWHLGAIFAFINSGAKVTKISKALFDLDLIAKD